MNQKDDEKKLKLTPELLVHGYVNGIFPMAVDGEVYWFCPKERGIIDFRNFKRGRHFRWLMRHHPFTIKIDCDFVGTMKNCASRHETWINSEIISAYSELHKLGLAHSVETWLGDELVGGLYLISIKSGVFGESMFSMVEDASKVALLFLIEHMKLRNFNLLDSQYFTEHLSRFNCVEISRSEYEAKLIHALSHDADFTKGFTEIPPPDPDRKVKRKPLD